MSDAAEKRLNRRELVLKAPPIELWPTVDPSHLPKVEHQQVIQLCEALAAFFGEVDTPVETILRRYNLHKETLYRAARRCLDKHDDGAIFGFRVALPYIRTKPYVRQTAVKPIPYERAGCAGAFGQLLRDFPSVEKTIRAAIRDRTHEVKTGGEVRQPMQSIHRAFIAACREAGVRGDNYPLNTTRTAFRSLNTYVTRMVEKDFDMAVSHAGGTKSRRKPGERGGNTSI